MLTALISAVPVVAAPVTIELPEPELTLKPGAGVDVTTNNCQMCHSLDYVQTQPPHMGAPFWTSEVTKMVKTFGAPISDADAKTIALYLAQTY
jgi:sulfite dehydrogenase (cytochrome) subunit B